jgi:repressor of nif and glnA expression
MSIDEVKKTPEEEALGHLLVASEGALSGAGHTLLVEAYKTAYVVTRSYSYYLQLDEYEKAVQKMRLEATRLTDRDLEYLTEIVRACEAAASFIDPNDETPAGYKVCRRNVRWHYQKMSEMIDDVLQGA